MEARTIKVSKETYGRLYAIAGRLQAELKRPVPLEEAIRHLIDLGGKGSKISDLAGSWDVAEEEVAKIKASLVETWRKWRLSES